VSTSETDYDGNTMTASGVSNADSKQMGVMKQKMDKL
jgi:hypothetical protein